MKEIAALDLANSNSVDSSFCVIIQVTSFSTRGVSAAHITGESSKCVKEGVQKGEYQLVYITPELLITGVSWRKMLVGEVYCERLKAFIVDEAHTVKKWYVSTFIYLQWGLSIKSDYTRI